MKIRSILLLFFSLFIILSAKTEKVKSSDGVPIAYTLDGKGEIALVFIHGWSCDKSFWSEQVKTFSKICRVVTLDLAGHGESGKQRKEYTVQLFGDDVAAVVNKLKLNSVILVGHSMGGVVSIEAANKLKGKVIGLIGADTFQNLGETLPADQVEPFLKPFQDDFVGNTKNFVKMMFPANADTNLVKKVSKKMSSAPPKIAISAMRNMLKDNGIAALKELSVPIVSINCDRYPIKVQQNMKLVKSYKLKMMEGYGHFIMLENPKKFDELLNEAVIDLSGM